MSGGRTQLVPLTNADVARRWAVSSDPPSRTAQLPGGLQLNHSSSHALAFRALEFWSLVLWLPDYMGVIGVSEEIQGSIERCYGLALPRGL